MEPETGYLQAYYSSQLDSEQFAPLHHVVRHNLLARLNDAAKKKLVVLSAPKGYGKTTLLHSYYQQANLSTQNDRSEKIWVSLNKFDNDPKRLMAKLVGTLDARRKPGAQHLDFVVALPARSFAQSEEQIIDLFNGTLFEQTGHSPTKQMQDEYTKEYLPHPAQQLVVIIDNFESLIKNDARAIILSLIEHSFPAIHIVLSTNLQLPLEFSFLRSEAKLETIKAEELLLSVADILELLAAPNQDKKAAAFSRAHFIIEKTEGWPFGALSLMAQRAKIQNVQEYITYDKFPHDVDDFFTLQVFSSLGENDRQFLMETSLYEYFDASLCNRVLERQDSQEVIDRLEKSLTFIIALDSTRQWFRYNRTFLDWLRIKLERESTGSHIRDLHARASAWFEKEGLYNMAARHAFASGDKEAALLLTRSAIELPFKEDIAKQAAWVMNNPSGAFAEDPRLCLISSWTYVHQGRPNVALKWVHALEQLVKQPDYSTDQREAINLATQSIKAVCSSLGNKYAESITASLQLLDTVQGSSESALEALLLHTLAESYERIGELEQAKECFAETVEISNTVGLKQLIMYSLYEISCIHYLQGNIAESILTCQEALDACPLDYPMHNALNAQLVRAYKQIGDKEKAAANLECALDGLSHDRNLDLFVDVSLIKVDMLLAEGLLIKATRSLSQIFDMTNHHAIPRGSLGFAFIAKGKAALLRNNLAEAQDCLDYLQASSRQESLLLHLAAEELSAMILEKQGEPDRALQTYTSIIEQAYEKRLNIPLLEALTKKVILLDHQGKHAQATALLNKALHLGQAENIVEIFLAGGNTLRNLLLEKLASNRSTQRQRSYIKKILSAFQGDDVFCDTRFDAIPQEDMLTLLTSREVEILTYLSNGMSRGEIAEYAQISSNTVKTHVANIYSKLGVHTTAELLMRVNAAT